jgi:hypothetical protein
MLRRLGFKDHFMREECPGGPRLASLNRPADFNFGGRGDEVSSVRG